MAVSLTEKELITIIISIDKNEKLLQKTVIFHVEEKLNIDSLLEEHIQVIASVIRKYRKWKADYHKKYGYKYITDLASTEVALEIIKPSVQQEPLAKKTKTEENTLHRRPSLPFYDIGDRRKKEEHSHS